MRINVLASALSLGLLASVGGCGQTSYFEVDVTVNTNGLADSTCFLSMVNTCEMRVSGADSLGVVTLNSAACTMPTGPFLGKFQYATEKESGNVMFHIELFDGNHKMPPLGVGDATGAIKAGGRTTVALQVTPQAGFTCP